MSIGSLCESEALGELLLGEACLLSESVEALAEKDRKIGVRLAILRFSLITSTVFHLLQSNSLDEPYMLDNVSSEQTAR